MSDYRFTMKQHNGIDCLHVLIDEDEMTETYIPLDDILDAAVAHGYMSLVSEQGQANEQVADDR